VTFHFDIERDTNSTQDLGLQSNVYDLGTPRLDYAAFFVCGVNSDSLGLVILRYDLVLRLQVVLVDDLNLLGLCMPQEACLVLEEVGRIHLDLWHQALGFDGYGKHILAYAF